MQTESRIESAVMRRVYRVRLLRVATRGYVLGPALALLALWGIGREVWVAQVFKNAPADFLSAVSFYLSAFTHTEVLVQTLTLTVLAAVLWVVYDALRPYGRIRELRVV